MSRFWVSLKLTTQSVVEAPDKATARDVLYEQTVMEEARWRTFTKDAQTRDIPSYDPDLDYADLSGWNRDELDALPDGTIVCAEGRAPFVKQSFYEWMETGGGIVDSHFVEMNGVDRVLRLGESTWINPVTGKDMLDVIREDTDVV